MRIAPAVVFLLAMTGCGARWHREPVPAVCNRIWRVSFPKAQLEESERIVGMSVKIALGYVLAIDRIPIDWSVAVDASGGATVAGVAGHGAGALFSTDEFGGFLVVCESRSTENLGDSKFSVEGSLATTVDFQTTSTRTFPPGEMILEEERF